VTLDVALHQTPGIVQRQRRSRPDALSLERFVPAFDLSDRLRIVGRGPDVCRARDPNELLEVFGDKLRSIVGDDPGPRLRVKVLGALQYDLRCPPPSRARTVHGLMVAGFRQERATPARSFCSGSNFYRPR